MTVALRQPNTDPPFDVLTPTHTSLDVTPLHRNQYLRAGNAIIDSSVTIAIYVNGGAGSLLIPPDARWARIEASGADCQIESAIGTSVAVAAADDPTAGSYTIKDGTFEFFSLPPVAVRQLKVKGKYRLIWCW